MQVPKSDYVGPNFEYVEKYSAVESLTPRSDRSEEPRVILPETTKQSKPLATESKPEWEFTFSLSSAFVVGLVIWLLAFLYLSFDLYCCDVPARDETNMTLRMALEQINTLS